MDTPRLCFAAAWAVIGLAGCGNAADTVAAAPVAASATAVAPGQADGYLGVWAATPALCRGGAWRFTTDRVSTAGEVECEVADIQRGVGSWALSVACTAEGEQTPGRLTLALLDPAEPDVMTVRGGPFDGTTTLTRCNL